MDARRGLLVLWIAAALLGSGCASSPWASAPSAGAVSITRNPDAGASEKQGPSAGPAATGPLAAGPAAGQSARQVDPREVDQLVAQVAAAERLDPAVREQLARDLRQTDPALWPAFVQQFRASLAFRRAREERDRAAAGGVVRAAGDGGRGTGREGLVSKPSDGVTPASANQPAEAMVTDQPAALRRSTAPERSGEDTGVVHAAAFLEVADRRETKIESPESRVQSREPRVESQESIAASRERPVKSEGPGLPPLTLDSQPSTLDWQKRLSAAIAALESELRDAPQSAPGVDLQARLRMLYLLADRREDALRPIPSAPPAVQEFWSQ
jgi:hypothetical protein